jgi:RNAse (barnase) inhibitor barstar
MRYRAELGIHLIIINRSLKCEKQMVSLNEELLALGPPWIYLTNRANELRLSELSSMGDIKILHLDGRTCQTKAELLGLMQRVFEFPDYFGHNWDALDECVCDLDWLPADGYIVLMTESWRILSANDDEFGTFLEIMIGAVKSWASVADSLRPFKLILDYHETKEQEMARRLQHIPPDYIRNI